MDNLNPVDNIEKKAKKTIKDTARKAKETAKKLAKLALKQLIKFLGIKGILIIIVICIIVYLLPILYYGISKSIHQSTSDIAKSVTDDGSGNIIRITEKKDRKYVINKTELEERLNNWYKNGGISKAQVGLSDDLSTLEKFMEAEIVTTYPDLRERDKIGTAVPEGELQGCIQFHRKCLDGTTKVLEYTEYDKFALELAKLGIKLDENQTQEQIYFEKDEIEKAYTNLEDKFTLNNDDDLIVVNMVAEEKQIIYSEYAKAENNEDYKEYNSDIEVTEINYQSVIQKYTMPFEFCMAILMTSRNEEFSKEVAELAIDSKIVIDMQDNITTNVTTEVYSFDVEFQVKRYIKYFTLSASQAEDRTFDASKWLQSYREGIESLAVEYSPYPIEGETKFNVDPYKTTINTLKNNDIKLCVTQAKTWIADYNSEYTNIVENPEIEDIISEEPDDSGFSEVSDYHGLISSLNYSLPKNSIVTEDRGEVKEKRTNKKTNFLIP